MKQKADIGLIGLGVMGQNLVLNMDEHGYIVTIFNRTSSRVDDFIEGKGRGTNILGSKFINDFIDKLKRPRIVMLMVKAGKPVDLIIEQLLPFLEDGDIIIDGGNANYKDSMRVGQYLESKKINYVGCGVSGGEEGARKGPSLMPGGSIDAWPFVKELFQAISAKAADGTPCCEWVGENGSGHFVKMVHNGIEYGDMQLICEAYDLMKSAGMNHKEMVMAFNKWNDGKLNSYLIDITKDILDFNDQEGNPFIEKILDTAGQKGTGMWTSVAAMELGIPLTLIGEAVFARSLSSLKNERVIASKVLYGPQKSFSGNLEIFVDELGEALYASKIISYTQGYMLFNAASVKYNWNLNYGAISLMWREGCIIRARFLEKIKEAFDKTPGLQNLLLDNYFKDQILSAQKAWRSIVLKGIEFGIPLPAMSSALAFFDGYRSERLPANLLQAQRDYFGSHTFERVDKVRGEFFHNKWIHS